MRIGIITLFGLLGWSLWASDGGSLLGTITDPVGAAVPGAKITATEVASGVKQTITTDTRGFYSFQSLPVGRYEVDVSASGFKPLRRTGVVIDVNSKIVVDASLAIGERTDAVTVSESAAQVETVDTQMGEVITGKQMTAVPLHQPQLHGPAGASIRRGAGHFHHLRHGSGCGRQPRFLLPAI